MSTPLTRISAPKGLVHCFVSVFQRGLDLKEAHQPLVWTNSASQCLWWLTPANIFPEIDSRVSITLSRNCRRKQQYPNILHHLEPVLRVWMTLATPSSSGLPSWNIVRLHFSLLKMCVAIDLRVASEVWAEGLCITSSGRTLRASVGFYRSFLPVGPERETPGDGGLVRLVLAREGRGLAPSLQPGLGMEHEQDSTFMIVGHWDFRVACCMVD